MVLGLLLPAFVLFAVVGGSAEQASACAPAAVEESGLSPLAAAVMESVTREFGEHSYAGVGTRADNPESDHATGHAVDVMIADWDRPSGVREGDRIAGWLQAHAVELGITYLIWRDQIWNTGDGDGPGAWSTYSHPSGGMSLTQRHMDHVHVSVDDDPALNVSTVADCVPVAAGGVVYPVPADYVDDDAHNWGQSGSMWSSMHTGTDFSAPCETPVYAAHAGTIEIDTDEGWAGPQLVKVVTGEESLATWYAHLETVAVQAGDVVVPGQQIGTVGELGNATGCHLHFEVHLRNGPIYGDDNVDPSQWLAENVGQSGSGVRVATFNVLGHSHTKPGGNKPGWPDSGTRIRGGVTLLEQSGVQIVGFQEFEPVQSRAFLAATGGQWEVYPRSSVGNTVNTVAWRDDLWEAVSARRVPIPYFGGNEVLMPVVLLRDRATGAQMWVGSFHNPADVRGPAQRWRDEAERRQLALATNLNATGTPVVITGDMNDREEYFCDTVATGVLHAANGGTASPCRPPANMQIDWIMGTPEVTFSGYLVNRTPLTARLADHPLVLADLQLS